MVQCANCQNIAEYTYQITEGYVIHYCETHLPRVLGNLKSTGELALKIAEEKPVEVEAPKTKKKSAILEEAPEEESPTEK
jgi:hypothetical protein